ncbi:cupin domain-containing protein [Corallococcus exercitus]|nr:cupin domain-containing protein [Corallococcus exercitus]
MGKIEEGYSLEQHVEGQSRHLDAPELGLDLAREMEELRQGAPFGTNGHSAKTLVKYTDLRVVLMAFKSGARLGQHRTVGQLSIQVLEGRVRLVLEREQFELSKGGLFALGSSVPHDVEAIEESAVLLTIAWPQVGVASHP